jgi:hypothetical protein
VRYCVLSVGRWLGVAADALALSTVADLEEVGITGAASVSIAGYFGNLDDEENLEPEPEPESLIEPPVELPSGPMTAFDEAAVLAWLGTVPGLTVAERAAAHGEMAEDEYDGPLLAIVTSKTLRRLLKGTEAERAVPLLLAARDAYLAAAAAAAAEQLAAAKAGPLAPPDEFVCAISQQLMVDPVTADEGATAILDCHRLRASRFATQRCNHFNGTVPRSPRSPPAPARPTSGRPSRPGCARARSHCRLALSLIRFKISYQIC